MIDLALRGFDAGVTLQNVVGRAFRSRVTGQEDAADTLLAQAHQ